MPENLKKMRENHVKTISLEEEVKVPYSYRTV